MGTWDLGTRGEGRGYAGTSNIGDAEGKVGGKFDISFFVKMCCLWSTLDSIVQNHVGHLINIVTIVESPVV